MSYGKLIRNTGKKFLLCIIPLLSMVSRAADAGIDDPAFTLLPSVFYQYESGVSNRFSIQEITTYTFARGLTIALGSRFHLNENTGLGSLSLSVRNIPGLFPWMTFRGDIAHLEYPDFTTGENQLIVLMKVSAFKHIKFQAGMGYRSPDFAVKKFHSLFDWTHEADELYPVMDITWNVIDRNPYFLSIVTGNYFFMDLRTLDHWMAGIQGSYSLNPDLQLNVRLLSAIKGISGFVFSINEIQADAGILIRF